MEECRLVVREWSPSPAFSWVACRLASKFVFGREQPVVELGSMILLRFMNLYSLTNALILLPIGLPCSDLISGFKSVWWVQKL
mgnify:CR=1 FL=1